MAQSISTSQCLSPPLHNSLLQTRDQSITPLLQLDSSASSLHSLNLTSLHSAKQIHAHIIKTGETSISERLLHNLIKLCSQSGSIQPASMLLSLLSEEGIECGALWNEAVVSSLENESWSKALALFRVMQSSNVKADGATIAKLINACGRAEALVLGREIHGHVIRCGLSSDLLVSNSLITMYSRNSCLNLARRVFETITSPNVVSWNSIISCCSLNGCLVDAMELFHGMVSSAVQPDLVTWNSLISGYSIHGNSREVFELFKEMQSKGLKPNSSTITSVLRAVSHSNLIKFGKEMHGYVMRHGLESSVYIGTSLVDMYIKCCSLTYGRKLFETVQQRNEVTWNSMISGYAYLGFLDEALKLLKRMDGEGLRPNLNTWNSLISGCSMHGQSKQALVLIRQLKATGLKPDVISWTALISGCCQNEQYDDSLYFFTEMQSEGLRPNSATIATVLRACASLSLLNKGTELHCFAIRSCLDKDIFVATALIDMYWKSGSLQNAENVFNKIEYKNLAQWNAMIMGLAAHGHGKRAIFLFHQMCRVGVNPDGITFTALLSSCRHSGMINEGWKYFDEMKTKFSVDPRVEHYTCMVDLLARGGYIDEALDIIRGMPLETDASLWGALLKACRIHRNIEIAELSATKLFKLEPHNPANYVMMMSIYASEECYDDVENIRIAMNAAGLKNKAGWSWIQVGQSLHLFSGEGKQHSEIGETYFELYQLVSEMRSAGYVPDTGCIVHNVNDKEKERLLMGHTEKLAITYGLIHSVKNAVIRVMKSTRMCNDCHEFAKYVSEKERREIYLRDGVRFHHFKSGKCSCNDYW